MTKLFKNVLFIVLTSSFLTFSCNSDDSPQVIQDVNQLEIFLNETMDIMERNSVNRLTIDWPDFRSRVLATMGSNRFIRDADPALREALRLLGDNHSFISKRNGTFLSESAIRCDRPTALRPVLPDDIGYVKVRSYSGSGEGEAAQNYIKDVREQIREADKEDLTGWVVDLRGNLGGNMYPMIAGVGPILGEGTAGYFIDPEGRTTSWGYDFHGATAGSRRISVSEDRYDLINPNPKVAVLIDGAVASSGEVVAISFIGRENTRLFGTPSCGLSTANRNFELSDGSTLFLTVSVLADRNQNMFGEEIQPDQVSTSDQLVDDLVEWLRND